MPAVSAEMAAAGLPCSGQGLSVAAGQELHQRIGPERWCVTRRDLVDLRRLVVASIKSGTVAPAPGHEFDPADWHVGPSIYTVNEQIIKPTTLKAGGMSWALMLHPEGLPCDLFITHAWREGIFEFLDKVIWSWPWQAKHAWCCFLANPQNLDIAGMIQSPPESPFAKALLSASHMLVVSNSKSSIYTRLWCAYEAFLAHEAGKVILMASPPTWRVVLRAVAVALLCAAFGGACSLLVTSARLFHAMLDLQQVLMALTVASASPRARRWFNLVGTALGAFELGVGVRSNLSADAGLLVLDPMDEEHLDELVEWIDWACTDGGILTLFFLLAEVDRVRYLVARGQATELKVEFTGTVADARCTDPRDEHNIRREIGHHTAHVDETVRLLIHAGMSTPSLRAASECGILLNGAGFFEYSFATYLLLQSVSGMTEVTDGHWRARDGLSLATKALACAWLLLFYNLPLDGRAFACRVLQKVGLVVIFPVFFISHIIFETVAIWDDWLDDTVAWSLYVVQWLVAILLSGAQIHRVARLPWCGRQLAQWLAWRGIRVMCSGRGHWEPLDCSSSSSDDDSTSSSDD